MAIGRSKLARGARKAVKSMSKTVQKQSRAVTKGKDSVLKMLTPRQGGRSEFDHVFAGNKENDPSSGEPSDAFVYDAETEEVPEAAAEQVGAVEAAVEVEVKAEAGVEAEEPARKRAKAAWEDGPLPAVAAPAPAAGAPPPPPAPGAGVGGGDSRWATSRASAPMTSRTGAAAADPWPLPARSASATVAAVPSSADDATADDAESAASTPQSLISRVRHNRRKEVKKALTEGKADVNTRDEVGNTLLIVAAQNGHLKMATLLLKLGADVDAANSRSKDALTFARTYQHKEVEALLIAHGAT